MLGLAFEEVHRYQQWKVRVLRARGLDAPVDLGLHSLPDRVAGRPDDHGPAGRTVLGQLRLGQDILVPPWEVLVLRSQHRHLLPSPYSDVDAARPYPPSLRAGEKRNFLPDLVGEFSGQGLDVGDGLEDDAVGAVLAT